MPQRALHNAGSMSAQGLFATLKAPSARPPSRWLVPAQPPAMACTGRQVCGL